VGLSDHRLDRVTPFHPDFPWVVAFLESSILKIKITGIVDA